MNPPPTLHTVQTRQDLRDFIAMPAQIYRDDPNWVRPLDAERRAHLSPANPYYRHAEVRLRIARDGQGRPVGRISTQCDTLAPRVDGRPEGHFGLIEAVNPGVMHVLLADAEAWLRERSVTRIVGPYSLSVNDESGLLVEGHGLPPRLMMNYAPEWYAGAIEAQGYTKAKDLLAMLLDLDRDLPSGAIRMAGQAGTIPGFRERPLRSEHFDEELRTIGAIFNDAWRSNWGYVPLTDDEIRHLGASLKPLVEPDLVRFVEVDGKPVGMVVALADINEALRGLHGRLWPFGWARLLWRLKVRRPAAARVILMGVSRAWQKDLRSAALVAALLVPLHQALRRRQYRKLELSWILEDNRPTLRLAELFGGVIEKRYRLYQKELS
ncbi:MAG: hypothetical protein PHQ04_03280 [Opitutaceae bacterium]|nr:hypothetical protein [Opitutaceae bacterium]